MSGAGGQPSAARLIPGAYSARFARVFGWYVERRLFARRFHGVHVVRSTLGVMAGLNEEPAPVIVLLNHPSWWDPLAAALLGYRFCLARTVLAPIDAEQLRKFGFFRRLGLFGIDPDDSASLEEMVRYVDERFRLDPRPTLWITPQGDFTDVRLPVRIRPGAAAIAARHPGVRVLCAAMEYGFWSDAKPELFIRLEACEPEEATTTGWYRAMTAAMQRNQGELARLVTARDPALFEPLVGGEGARINPAYDLWLRLRGRRGAIDPRRERSVDKPHAGARARRATS